MSPRLLPSLFFLVALLPLPSNAADAIPDPTAWRDAVRDVYINGTLDRPAQVLVAEAPRRLAVVSSKLPHVVVYDTEAKKAWRVAKDAFTFTEDRLKATAVVPVARRKSAVTSTVEGVQATRLGRDLVVVAPHQSSAGPMSLAALADGYPAWGASSRAYATKPRARASLAAIASPAKIKIVFATWCGDSKYYVPRVIGALADAANPNLEIELIGVGPDFHSPLDLVQENRIINVPTIIVEQGGIELGRITETPVLGTVEEDLAAIFAGNLPQHEGRWEREAKIASGMYELTEEGRPAGTEEWTIFTTPSGGRLLHSVVRRSSTEREVWQTFDRNGATTFVEVTDRSGGAARRTRYRRGAGTMSAHSRGSDSGIIDQLVAIPETCGFDSGTVAAAASGCQVTQAQRITRYCIDASEAAGRLAEAVITPGAHSGVEIAASRIDARHFSLEERGMTEELLVDEELRIPIQLASSDGTGARLVTLERY